MCAAWDALGKRQPSLLTIRPGYQPDTLFLVSVVIRRHQVYPQSAQIRSELLLHHRFSCCSYSSAGSILLIHMTKRQTAHTVLVHSELSSTCLPPVILLKQDASLVLIALTLFLPSSILLFVLPLHSLPVYSCLFSLPPGCLHLFRQDLSSSVKLQSAHRSLGCLERLTMTYQTLQTFN